MIFFWIALYGLTYSAADYISHFLQMQQHITAIAMAVYTGLFFLWLFHTKWRLWIRLHAVPLEILRSYLFYLPLALLPLYQLLAFGPPRASWSTILLLLTGAVMEEIFFRGFLLRSLCSLSRFKAILAASLVFSLFHGVNFFLGYSIGHVLLQVLCTFCVSFGFCAVVLTGGGLLPCIVAHCLINFTGAGIHADAFPLLLIASLYLVYGIRLCRT